MTTTPMPGDVIVVRFIVEAVEPPTTTCSAARLTVFADSQLSMLTHPEPYHFMDWEVSEVDPAASGQREARILAMEEARDDR